MHYFLVKSKENTACSDSPFVMSARSARGEPFAQAQCSPIYGEGGMQRRRKKTCWPSILALFVRFRIPVLAGAEDLSAAPGYVLLETFEKSPSFSLPHAGKGIVKSMAHNLTAPYYLAVTILLNTLYCTFHI